MWSGDTKEGRVVKKGVHDFRRKQRKKVHGSNKQKTKTKQKAGEINWYTAV